jgi:hypothetical protein
MTCFRPAVGFAVLLFLFALPTVSSADEPVLRVLKLLIVRMSFADRAAQYSSADMETAAATIRSNIARMSNGRVTLETTVTDAAVSGNMATRNANCPMGATTCPQTTLERDTLTAAGVGLGSADLRQYDAALLVQPDCVGASGNAFRDVTYPGRASYDTATLKANLTRAWDLPCDANQAAPRPFAFAGWVHEFGHELQIILSNERFLNGDWFGHPSGYSSGYSLMDSCYPCGESAFGITDRPVNTSTRRSFTNFLSTSRVQVIPTPSSGTVGRTVVLAPLSDLEAETPARQAIKIPIDGTRYYLVESRTKANVDQPIPDTRGGVVINLVDDSRVPPVRNIDTCDYLTPGGCIRDARTDPRQSSCVAPISFPTSPAYCWPYPLWQPGQTFTDPANHIQIRVADAAGDGDVVTVRRGTVTAEPDIYMIPWQSPPMNTWETTDIWVDSSCNGYEDTVGPAGLRYGRRHNDTVIGNGDDPCANHENRIYAVVRNSGDASADHIVVHFKVTDPLGMGIRGARGFVEVGTADETAFPVLASLAPGATAVVYANWTPRVARSATGTFAFHSCVSVAFDTVSGEDTISNQDGDGEQENFDNFELPRLSRGEFAVSTHSFHLSNLGIDGIQPEDRQMFWFVPEGRLPKGWTLSVNDGIASYSLARKESAEIPVKISAPPDAVIGKAYRFGLSATTVTRLVNVAAGDRMYHDAGITVAGIAYAATPVLPTKLKFGAQRTGVNQIAVSGALIPAIKGQVVTVDVTRKTPNGPQTASAQAKTDGDGSFSLDFTKAFVEDVQVQAFFQGTRLQSSVVAKPVLVPAAKP